MRVGFVLLAAAAIASADSLQLVSFSAPSQAFWGPGVTAASFDEGGEASFAIAGGRAGVGFNVDASTGTIGGSYSGGLSFLFPNVVTLGSGPLSLGTLFGGGGGSFSTSFGASMDVYGFVRGVDGGFLIGEINIHASVPPFPLGNTLATSKSFSGNLGSTTSWSGATNFDIAAVSFPPIIPLVEFGPTFKVTQGSTFVPTGIGGTLVYRNRDTGTERSTAFTVGGAPVVDLSEAGIWDFSLRDLTLFNNFRTGFDGAIGGFVDIFIFGRSSLTTSNFNLFDTATFGLNFNEITRNNAFSIEVVAPGTGEPVPEPATLGLMGVALAFLLRSRVGQRAAPQNCS